MATSNYPIFTFTASNAVFLSSKNKSYTYQDLASIAHHVKKELAPFSISQKHPLLIVTANSTDVVLLFAACFMNNIPVLPVHPDTTSKDLDYLLSRLQPSAIFNAATDTFSVPDTIPEFHFNPDELSRPDLEREEFTGIQFASPESIAGYFQTSGSTGPPKIVPIKRRQVLYAAKSSERNFRPDINKYWLLCLPLNHVGGVSVIYRSLLYGSAIYLITRFRKEEVRNLLHENKKFEAASMVPTMLLALLEESFFRVQFNFKGLLLGGGPISLSLINEATTRGIPIVISYGMTETFGQIVANPTLRSGGMYIPKRSVGVIFRDNDMEIRDENGQAIPALESGRIWLKGPQVFDGYLDPARNEGVFDSDGWFDTGDFGHVNRKRQLYIESRRTDLIITGGENVNPYQVEEELQMHPDIAEAAVIGVPDKKWGQRVVAFLVLKSSAETEPSSSGLTNFLKNNLRSFSIPKEYILISHLPKTETQKVKRQELRTIYMNEYQQGSD